MILRIRVKPGSKTDEIVRETDGTIKVKIRAQPIEGKANQYLIDFLGKVFGLPKSRIKLLKGKTNSFKKLEIDAEEGYVWTKLTEQLQ